MYRVGLSHLVGSGNRRQYSGFASASRPGSDERTSVSVGSGETTLFRILVSSALALWIELLDSFFTGLPWICLSMDMRLRPSCGYYAGAPAN